MHISAKADYAMRALLVLAAAPAGRAVKGETVAASQGLPPKFTENILVDLRRTGIVASQRGRDGGFRLARPPEQITVADVIRAVDGPLAEVRGMRPEDVRYEGPAAHLGDVWLAVRVATRSVLERVTLAQVAAGALPARVRKLAADPEAGVTRPTRPAPPPPRQPRRS